MRLEPQSAEVLAQILLEFYTKEISREQALQLLIPLSEQLEADDLDELAEFISVSEHEGGNIWCARLWAELLLEVFQQCQKLEGVALMLLQLGKIYHSCEQYEEAVQSFTKLLLLISEDDTIRGKESLIQHADSGLARTYLSMGEFTPASLLFGKAAEVAKSRHDWESCARYYQDMGVANRKLQYLPKTLECYLNALDQAVNIENYPYRGLLESNIAAAYIDLGEYDTALPHAEEALRICLAENRPRDLLHVLGNLGALKYELGCFEEASWYYENALELSQSLLESRQEATFRAMLNKIKVLQIPSTPPKDQERKILPALFLRKMRDFEIGEFILPELKILERMEGSKGIVYKLEDTERKGFAARRYLCAKTLKSEYFKSDREVEKFLQEAKNWLGLRQYVTLASALFYEHDLKGKPYVFVEYADGGSLRDLLCNGFRPWESDLDYHFALKICLSASWALAYIQKKSNLIHGDISLDNLLLHGIEIVNGLKKGGYFANRPIPSEETQEWTRYFGFSGIFPKVTDFGLSRVYNTTDGKENDFLTDIQDFGVRVLYQLFTGSSAQQVRGRLIPPIKIQKRLDQRINALIVDCYERRLTSFDQVSEVLRDIEYRRFGMRTLSPEECFERDSEMVIEALNFGLKMEYSDKEASTPLNETVVDKLREPLRQHIETYGARQIPTSAENAHINLDLPSTVLNQAYGYFKLKQYHLAERHYLEALSLCDLRLTGEPENLQTKKVILHNLGVLYQTVGNYKQATQFFEKERDLIRSHHHISDGIQ